MKRRNNEFNILTEHLDEEVLQRMPEWFQILRSAYGDRIKS